MSNRLEMTPDAYAAALSSLVVLLEESADAARAVARSQRTASEASLAVSKAYANLCSTKAKDYADRAVTNTNNANTNDSAVEARVADIEYIRSGHFTRAAARAADDAADAAKAKAKEDARAADDATDAAKAKAKAAARKAEDAVDVANSTAAAAEKAETTAAAFAVISSLC